VAGLQTYASKRDFSKTREPRGARAKQRGNAFVIQKHAARRLHYDFRLELDGVLKSWAVTRGPSLVPGEKRLAVEVEDHPIEYQDFEGAIPKGQYGGGTVLVWDRGTWTPHGDPHEGLAKGRLDFALDGEKLHGLWHLVRMRRNAGDKRTNWLLIKAHDDAAREAGDADILEQLPRSVLSRRTIDEIAAEKNGRTWTSNRGQDGGGAKAPAKRAKQAKQGRAPARAPAAALDVAARGLRDDKPAKDVVREDEAMARHPPASASGRSFGVKLTHPDRIYWPDAGVTKQGLAEYYADVWKWMAPHVVARPLALVRCPDGIGDKCFFQKAAWKGIHRSVSVLRNPGEGGDEVLAIHDLDGLVALVQAGVLEIHPWGSTVDDLDCPDRLIFDLDPGPDVGWAELVRAAQEVRARLHADGIESFLKTTGGKGLHVVAPLAPVAHWDEVKPYTRSIAEAMAADSPDRYVAKMSKRLRSGHIFVDYLRNGRGATSVAPYSTRARPGAPVSTPLAWEELGPDVHGAYFRVANLPTRLAHLDADPWSGFFKPKQRLPTSDRRGKTNKSRR
jgi:bifunctional non-homologous end joining protein LigD